MIFSPEGVVSAQDYEYQIKAICKMVSNKNHWFGAAVLAQFQHMKGRYLGKIRKYIFVHAATEQHSKGRFLN